jgi:hypothetical protein
MGYSTMETAELTAPTSRVKRAAMKSISKPKLALASLLIFVCAAALAVTESPFRRTCRTQGGISWEVRLEDDQISLCRFRGLGVDSETLYNQLTTDNSPLAVNAFLSQTEPGASSPREACENSGGNYIPVVDLEDVPTALCQFSDNSRIEARALSVGSGPGAGAALAHALRR